MSTEKIKNNKKASAKSEESEKNNKDNKSKKSLLFIGLIILGIVIVFIISYFVSKNINNTSLNEKRLVYNNFVFVKQDDNTWSVDLSIKNAPYSIPFYYNPTEVDNITAHPDIIPAFKRFMEENPGGKVYVAVDPYEPSKVIIAGVEFTRLLGTRYNIFNFNVTPAFTRNHESQNLTYPIVTCREASSNQMVVILYVGNMTAIGYKNNCVLLQAASVNDTIRVADAFSYRLLGIIR